MGFFVKFCKYNHHTLENLILQQIRFSTVYDFNDFNELRYIAGAFERDVSEAVYNKINETDIQTLANYITSGYKSGRYDKEYLDKFLSLPKKEFLEKTNFENIRSFLEECFAFNSVGIFCCSDIKVFESENASLMFAHYADNLNGLALIYEMKNDSVSEVIYDGSDINSSSGETNRIIKWLENDYTDMDDFLRKSKVWEYESEYRIFNSPGNKNIPDQLKLKGLFYTSRFKGNIETLKEINKNVYNDALFIEEIRISYDSPRIFIMNDKSKIINWLQPKTP